MAAAARLRSDKRVAFDPIYFDDALFNPFPLRLHCSRLLFSAPRCSPFSSGFALAANSFGDGGVPAPFAASVPSVYNVSAASYLYMYGGTNGVDVGQGSAGASIADVAYGAAAPGGAAYASMMVRRQHNE